jgi:hypothetical protein
MIDIYTACMKYSLNGHFTIMALVGNFEVVSDKFYIEFVHK